MARLSNENLGPVFSKPARAEMFVSFLTSQENSGVRRIEELCFVVVLVFVFLRG